MPRSCRHSLHASYGENRFTFGAETAHTICMFQMNNYIKLHKNYVLQVHQSKKKKKKKRNPPSSIMLLS